MIDHPSNLDDLKSMPVEQLATLVEWMIPPSRKQEVEDFRSREKQLRIREKDLQARNARRTKPGERMKDSRGYYRQRTELRQEIESQLRTNTATNAQRSAQVIADQERLKELCSLLTNRLQKLQAEREDLKTQLQNPTSRQAEGFAEDHQGQAYLKGFGWLSPAQLGDLILSDRFEQQEERCRKEIVDKFLALEEVVFESAWKELEDGGLSHGLGNFQEDLIVDHMAEADPRQL